MIVERYLENSDLFVFPFEIERGKIRTIITYRKDNNGNELKDYHKKILKKLNKLPSSKFSYAYKKGCCTKDAFKYHMNSNFYIKLDIKSFFESINFDSFVLKTKNIFTNFSTDDLKSCFYGKNLSLGYVTSPKISDLYLYNFDRNIEGYLKVHKQLHYSRYCDDILISSEDNDFGALHTLLSYIKKELLNCNLEINDKKVREYDLSEDIVKQNKIKYGFNYYPYVTFLGLNLVRKNKARVITISKHFILKTIDIIGKIESKKAFYKEKILLRKNNRKDFMLKDEIKKLEKEIKKLCSIANSRVAYIKFNSKDSYNKFSIKYKNKYNRKWRNIWL